MIHGIIAVYPERKKNMNDEYTYDEELKLSADRDMFDDYRFRTGVEDSMYEAESGELPTNTVVSSRYSK